MLSLVLAATGRACRLALTGLRLSLMPGGSARGDALAPVIVA
jgi:hypothetical protein